MFSTAFLYFQPFGGAHGSDIQRGTQRFVVWRLVHQFPPSPGASHLADYPGVVGNPHNAGALHASLLAAWTGLAVYMVVFPIVFGTTIALQVLKRMPSANTIRWCTEVIDPWGFRCFVPEGEKRSIWQQIRKVAETPGYFFVFATGGKGYLIPKRAFASPAHADAYRQQALAYWEAAKRGAPLAPTPIQSMGVPQVAYSAGDPAQNVWPPAPRVG